MDKLQQELLAVFDAEYRDHLGAIRRIIDRGRVERAEITEIFRRVHSLKGAARAVGRREVERISHDLEGMLQALQNQQRLPDEHELLRLARDLDAIEGDMDGGVEPQLPSSMARARSFGQASSASDQETYVQVPLSRLEALASAMHAVVAANEARAPIWKKLENVISVKPRHGQTPLVRSQSLEMSIILSERQRMEGEIARAIALLQQEIQSISLVRAGSVFSSLGGMARQIARDLNGIDSVEVHLHGMDLLADRRVMQSMRDPALQLLRNAIVHGAESRVERQRLRKPEVLQIYLDILQDRNFLVLSITDDGRGPDTETIARQARKQGLLRDGKELDESRLLSCVFEPGFSTRTQADELAGRGMGLSIVAEGVRALNGSVTLARGEEAGTVVTIRLPLAKRNRTILIVESAGQTLGIDAGAVERLLWLSPEEILKIDDDRQFVKVPYLADPSELETALLREKIVPLLPLSSFIGGNDSHSVTMERMCVICVTVGDDSRALLVDAVTEARDMIVQDAVVAGLDRELVPDLGWLREDWPVLVVDFGVLFERWDRHAYTAVTRGVDVAPRPNTPTILVVDDSITTRTLEKAILQGHGYNVVVAVDGVQALEILRVDAKTIDAIVTDVEMPRMDGFALLAATQADPLLASIPVVLMTSRNEEEDIRKGMEGGARAYITKQGFEQGELLETIRNLI